MGVAGGAVAGALAIAVATGAVARGDAVDDVGQGDSTHVLFGLNWVSYADGRRC